MIIGSPLACGAGSWCESGGLQFGFGDDAEFEVAAGEAVVIAPDRVHHVAVDDAIRFVVEFHRPPATVAP